MQRQRLRTPHGLLSMLRVKFSSVPGDDLLCLKSVSCVRGESVSSRKTMDLAAFAALDLRVGGARFVNGLGWLSWLGRHQ